MSNLSSVLSSSQVSSSSSSAADQLVAAYKQTQQSKIDTLDNKKKSLEDRQIFFNTLKSKIDNLVTYIDRFTASNASSKFTTRTITSSNTAVATASVTADATVGINSLRVNNLASNDILIGAQMSVTSSDLFGMADNTYTFKVNGSDVSVNLTADMTNESAMKAIVSAINANSNTNVSANYLKDTSTTGRITLTATQTGSDNHITFDDNGSGVLTKLGFGNVDPNATNRTPTNSGSTYAHYKLSSVNDLNASFELNGINISRGTNTITDVLQGTTINLVKTMDSTDSNVIFQTSTNPTDVVNLVNPLLSSYNDLLSFLKQNSSTIRSESGLSSLSYKLRDSVTQSVTSAPNGYPQYLTDLGIKISSDGSLNITDTSHLSDLLKDNPDKVAQIFTGSDGFAQKLSHAISNLMGDNGLIAERKNSLSTQITYTTNRTQELSDRIDRQAEALRKEYQNMLQVYLEAQQQYSTLTSSYSSTS